MKRDADSRYAGSPEDLHNISHRGSKQSVDGFVNPGTPQEPLVGMEDRKTGVVAGSASQRLRERLNPAATETASMSSKADANGGKLSGGRS